MLEDSLENMFCYRTR